MDDQQPETPKFNVPQPGRSEPDKVPDAPLPSEVNESKPKRSRKKLFIIVAALLVLIIAGAGAWYFLMGDEEDAGQQSQTTETQAEVSMPTYEGLPDKVAYAYRETDTSLYILYTRSALGGDRVEAMTLPEGTYVTQSVVRGNKIAIATEADVSSAESPAIWYSSDGGSSYQKIYEGERSDGDSGTSTQFTSLVFSNDETALLVGVLKAAGETNEVTEISLSGDFETKTVFESDQAGVFLEGYSKQTGQIIFFEGCYNCDGNRSDILRLHNVAKNESNTLYESEVGLLKVGIDNDFSKILIAEGAADPASEGFLGGGVTAPYSIKLLSLSDLASPEELTVAEGNIQSVGFTYAGTPYYMGEQEIVRIGDTNTAAFNTAGVFMLNGDYFVGEDSVVAAIGSFDNFTLDYFKTGDEASTIILNGDSNTIIFGVVIK